MHDFSLLFVGFEWGIIWNFGICMSSCEILHIHSPCTVLIQRHWVCQGPPASVGNVPASAKHGMQQSVVLLSYSLGTRKILLKPITPASYFLLMNELMALQRELILNNHFPLFPLTSWELMWATESAGFFLPQRVFELFTWQSKQAHWSYEG